VRENPWDSVRVHAGGIISEERHGVSVSLVCKVGLERMEELTNICFLVLKVKKRNLVILVDHDEVGRQFEESGEDGDQGG